MADDYSSTITTTGRLAINGRKTGNFEATGDSDWFAVQLTAGTTYLFSLAGAADGGGTLQSAGTATLNMLNSSGVTLAYGANYGSPQSDVQLQFTASASGTYYLAAATGSTGASGLGTYTLRSWLPAADDYAGDTGSTGVLSEGVAVAGASERQDDSDWFRFHLEAGQVADFAVLDAVTDRPIGGLNVYDSAGRYLSGVYQSPFVAAQTGDYFLAVGAGGRAGAYSATMNMLTDDYSADNIRPGSIQAGGQAFGTLDFRDDTDRFHVSLQAGQFYTIALPAQSAGGAWFNLQVRDSDGNYVQGDGRTVDGRQTVEILATRSGTYSIDVGGAYNTSAGTRYMLSVSGPEADDYANTREGATQIGLDTTVTGSLQAAGDIDMFKVALTAGVTYRFDVPTGDGVSYYTGTLSDASGALVRYPSSSTEKSFTYTPLASGTYYLAQSGASVTPGATVDYSVTVSTAADDRGASVATAGRLAVGLSARGELEAGGGDIDWYAVTLDAGGYYWITLAGARENGGTLTPTMGNAELRLLDAQGQQLAKADYSYTGTTSLLPFTAPTKGTYYVSVSAPGSAGTYTVRAQLGQKDDYGNDRAGAAVVAIDKAVAGKLEIATDVDTFKLSATAGMTFAVEVAPGAGTIANWSSQAVLQVSSGADTLTTRDISSGGKIYKVFEAARDGDYYITLGNPWGSGVTGAYTLTVKPLGMDDYAGGITSIGWLAPGAPVQGVLGVPGDHDWVRVSLEAGRTYVFDLQGALSGHGTLGTGGYPRPAMTLLTADGGYTGVAGDSANPGAEPRMSFIATKTGDYFIDVYGGDNQIGSYTLVETVTSGDATAPTLLSSSVAPGAVNVSPTGKLVLTFDEIMMVGEGITLSGSNGVPISVPYGRVLATGLGNTVVIDPPINLTPGETYTLNLPQGGLLDLAGNRAAAASYSFTVRPAVAEGTSGNDYLLGSGSGAVLDGGAGLDTAFYTGARYSAQIGRQADGGATVGVYGQGGADQLHGVERLLFADSAVALDIDGVGGQVYRLYQSAFNRSPDSAGLGFWMSYMDAGMSLRTAASAFVGSAEFARLYGSAPTDAEFVNLLYNNVLHRAPEPAGASFWLGHLAGGLSRTDALVAFSESAENTAAVAAVIGNGFEYTPYG